MFGIADSSFKPDETRSGYAQMPEGARAKIRRILQERADLLAEQGLRLCFRFVCTFPFAGEG